MDTMKLKNTDRSYMKTKNAIIAYGCETANRTQRHGRALTDTGSVICLYSHASIAIIKAMTVKDTIRLQ